jgi:hypothetical protein
MSVRPGALQAGNELICTLQIPADSGCFQSSSTQLVRDAAKDIQELGVAENQTEVAGLPESVLIRFTLRACYS